MRDAPEPEKSDRAGDSPLNTTLAEIRSLIDSAAVRNDFQVVELDDGPRLGHQAVRPIPVSGDACPQRPMRLRRRGPVRRAGNWGYGSASGYRRSERFSVVRRRGRRRQGGLGFDEGVEDGGEADDLEPSGGRIQGVLERAGQAALAQRPAVRDLHPPGQRQQCPQWTCGRTSPLPFVLREAARRISAWLKTAVGRGRLSGSRVVWTRIGVRWGWSILIGRWCRVV